ncbi:hypothetical protein BGZ49_002030 [Haplosporangium sp. Z 27]|nr:hypothetical protein BGZ49_002030 [Haplosporangium sp. Z 27]
MLSVNLGSNNFDSVPMFGGLNSLTDYSVAWSSAAKGMFMFGGKVNGTINNLLLQYNSTWSTPTTSGSSPPPRSSACFVPAYNATTMVLFGGILNQGLPASDIYFLNLTTMAWTKGPDAGTADVRSSSSCAVTGDYFISWGGFDGSFPVRTNSTIVYNMKTNTWVSTFGSPLIPSATSSVAPSTATATKTTSTSTTTASSTPTPTSSVPSGAVAAGVTIPVVFVVVFVLFTRHRKHQREQREASTTNNTSHVDDTLDEVKGSYPTDTVVELKDNGEDYIKQKQRFSQFRGPATEYYQRFLSAVRNPSTGNQGADFDREAFSQNRLHRFSHLRGPATEGDPFGDFQRLFPTSRDPSTTDVGANYDRSHRLSHLRGPSASPSEHEQQPYHSERPRNPNTGENLFANIQCFSHLRGPSTTGTTATIGIHQNDQYHDDDDDWAKYYNNANWLDEEEQNDYIPPPPPTAPPMPPRPNKSRFPMPLGHPVNTERGLPNIPPVARHSTRRAPATFERESTFRYMDSTSL